MSLSIGSRALRCAAAMLVVATVPVWTQDSTSLRERMLLIEDARSRQAEDLETLQRGLADRDPQIRRQAARAIGRLERPELIASLTRALADQHPDVRMEAANAVGQLSRGPKGIADGKARLLARARAESDPRVWGVVAATLGRLQYATATDVDQVEAVIARVLPGANASSIQIDAVLGAVEGLEALARQTAKLTKLKQPTIDGLRAASGLQGRPQDADKLARIRRLATLALVAAGAVARPQLEAGIADEDAEVRRLTMVAARAEIEGREAVIAKGLLDANAQVRYEALRTWGLQLQKTACEPLIKAVRDSNPHVSLLALDLLGNGCPDGSPVSTVQAVAEGITGKSAAWHAPAHAFVSLAKLAPAEARKLLPPYVGHNTWQVRMYAAHAAGELAALDELERLGRDPHHNVREAALGELIRLKRPEAEGLALDAIARPDYQLVITASRALGNTKNRERAAPALIDALQRMTAAKEETSRDARLAVLDGIRQVGWPDGSGLGRDASAVLHPYLADFDPAIAERTAEILRGWQKSAAVSRPARAAAGRVQVAEIDALANARVRVSMTGRGQFELRLLTDEAPVTALHFATLAAQGYYNGRTFHRVVPNFVIQGGSPGANEYAGQGPFMRDEVGLVSHRRGTLGISTRGRDTGDAQIFVNLVDLPRLDHTYTVFAEVVSGMDVVDAILEGDTIERMEVARNE